MTVCSPSSVSGWRFCWPNDRSVIFALAIPLAAYFPSAGWHGGAVISRAAPEMQTDWQLSFKSGSLCLCHPPCCGDPANRHFMHDPALFPQDIKQNRPCVHRTHGLFRFITHLFHGVFSGVFPESAVVFLVVQLAAAQRLMDVQIMLGHIDNAAGDVGAVVGGAL